MKLVRIRYNQHQELIHNNQLIVSADSLVVNECKRWFNLAKYVIDNYIPDAIIIHWEER